MKTSLLLLIVLLLTCFISYSQQDDLTGTWEGSGGGSTYAKLCIIRVNNTYIGYTHDEGFGYCTCHYLGTYDQEKKKLKGMNMGVIEKTALHTQSRYNLNYVVIGGRDYLKGTVSPKSVGAKIMSFGIPSPASYTRVSKTVDTTDYMRSWLEEHSLAGPSPADSVLNTLADMPAEQDTAVTGVAGPSISIIDSVKTTSTANTILREKNSRITDTLSVIDIHEKELLIKVMDNGIVDGDTVSILHNGKVIAEKISVTAVPFELKIPVNSTSELQEIVLVAHNVGSISPNTALILIQTATKEYRLTASTDLHKNAMIIFRYTNP